MAKSETHQASEGRIFIAKESFAMNFNGADISVIAGSTRVREGHPLLKGPEHLFEPINVHYDVESATDAPGEKRGA